MCLSPNFDLSTFPKYSMAVHSVIGIFCQLRRQENVLQSVEHKVNLPCQASSVLPHSGRTLNVLPECEMTDTIWQYQLPQKGDIAQIKMKSPSYHLWSGSRDCLSQYCLFPQDNIVQPDFTWTWPTSFAFLNKLWNVLHHSKPLGLVKMTQYMYLHGKYNLFTCIFDKRGQKCFQADGSMAVAPE